MPRSRSPTRKRYSRSQSHSPRRRSGGRSRRSRSHSPRSRRPKHSPRRHSDHRARKSRSPRRRRSPAKRRSRSKSAQRRRSRSGSSSRSRSPPRKSNNSRDRRGDQRPVDRYQAEDRPRTPVDVRLNRLTGGNPEQDDNTLYTENEPIRQPVHKDVLSNVGQFEDNYGIGELDYDEEPVHSTPPRPVYQQQPQQHEEMLLLSQRFRDPQQPRGGTSFNFDENITVDIRRKLKDVSPEEIRRDFDPTLVLSCIHHKKGEGNKPIFDRDDIKLARLELEHQAAEEQVVERRIIAMVPSKNSGSQYQEDFSVQRGHVTEPTVTRMLGERWGSHIAQTMMSQQQVEPVVHRLTDNLRIEDLDAMYSQASSERRPQDPNDLRNALLRRRKNSERDRSPVFDARSKILRHEQRREQPVDRDRKSHRDSSDQRASRHSDRDKSHRHSNSSRDRAKDSKAHRDDSHHSERGRGRESRSNIQSRMLSLAGQERGGKDKESTPDFSRRPDKGKYESWKEDPTETPIGAYFEHDNRDGKGGFRGRGRGRGFVPRGRGRGFVPRGRGSYRGSYRGRGSYDSRRESHSDRRDDRDSRSDRRDDRDSRSDRHDDRRDDRRSDRRDDREDRSRKGHSDSTWKHDKFNELMEEDSKPSSTTKT